MFTSNFDYNLPQELIAQKPSEPRDHSRLMVVGRTKKTVMHQYFYDIVDYLRPGDVIVWNNSKVFKARLYGQLKSENGDPLFEHKREIEIFLVRPMENPGVWQVLAKPGRHVQHGTRVHFASDFFCDVVTKMADGAILVQFFDDVDTVRKKANQYGHVPIPPYVKDEVHELSIYQTVYAKHEGSVAAPTAGFHFTPALIEKAKAKGVEFVEVTLHVGLGTFLPVKSERVEDHTMHSEWVEVGAEIAEAVNRAKREGRRIIAIGTTTVRTLEGVARLTSDLRLQTSAMINNKTEVRPVRRSLGAGGRPRTEVRPYTGEINLFILPGFQFRVVDAMITNFHLPKSTLLMLVAAFVGDTEFVLQCYEQAKEKEYRFYSFGDAMFIF